MDSASLRVADGGGLPPLFIGGGADAFRLTVGGDGTMDSLTPVQIHGIVIDPAKWKVLVERVPISLTSYQFRVLHLLARNAGRTLSRQQIIAAIHGLDRPVSEHSVDVQVFAIRSMLGDHANLIETDRGVGYRFRA
jgi:two-component system phosphate regulon response regulator PhoB